MILASLQLVTCLIFFLLLLFSYFIFIFYFSSTFYWYLASAGLNDSTKSLVALFLLQHIFLCT